MSRFEGKIGEGGAPVDAVEILAALARDARANGKRRQDAVTCYLSGSDGWQEASEVLGGTFAAEEVALRANKDE